MTEQGNNLIGGPSEGSIFMGYTDSANTSDGSIGREVGMQRRLDETRALASRFYRDRKDARHLAFRLSRECDRLRFQLELATWTDPMDAPQFCARCGLLKDIVRPGKWQCPECD